MCGAYAKNLKGIVRSEWVCGLTSTEQELRTRDDLGLDQVSDMWVCVQCAVCTTSFYIRPSIAVGPLFERWTVDGEHVLEQNEIFKSTVTSSSDLPTNTYIGTHLHFDTGNGNRRGVKGEGEERRRTRFITISHGKPRRPRHSTWLRHGMA